jgi:hypothetical protein
MRSEAEIEIYVGEGTKAYERLQRDEAALKRSLLLKVQFIRVLTDFVRGRAAITSIGRCDPPQRAARIAEARRLARNLEGERMAWAAPLAAILDAATDHAEGRKASAVPSLEKAIKTAEAAEMAIYAASARHQLGLALGGDRGSEMVRQAEHFLRSQDIQAPARFASMLVPGRWADETGPTVASTAR